MRSQIFHVDFGAADELRRTELDSTHVFAGENDATLINLNRMSKKPHQTGWTKTIRNNRRVLRAAELERLNVGFLLTGQIVDIDIDDPTLLIIARHFLPETSRYGRSSKRSSHWLYVVEDKIDYQSIKSMGGHVEIRTGNRQTAAPGSIHPSGELYEWEDSTSPESISPYDLQTAIRFLVAASILREYWIEGQRDDLAVAVCGVLLRADYSVADINRFIEALCSICGDEEASSRKKAGRLARALKNGKNVPGIPSIKAHLGFNTQMFLAAIQYTKHDVNPLALVRADTIRPEPVRWLWQKRIALGKLTMRVGDPGTSKSTVALDIAARITTGRSFPDGTQYGEPSDVVLITTEDDAADTIVPRFMAAGGDRSRLHLLCDGFSLLSDKERLSQAITNLPRPALLILDPITEFIAARNPGDMSEARQILAPLGEMIREQSIACVAISHLNKDQAKSAIYRTTGSVAFVAIARAVYLVVKDTDERDRRLMLPIKNNLGPDQNGLAYTIQETTVAKITTIKVVWEKGEITATADQILSNQGAGKFSPKLAQASDWLSIQLSDGPVSKKILESKANTAGISRATLRRAKAGLGVISIKKGELGEGGYWEWALT